MPRACDVVSVFNRSKNSCLGNRVGVADHGFDRMIGLLGRTELAPGTGLFIVPSQAVHTIGMKFPIDVIFVDKHYKVLAIRSNLAPCRITRVVWKSFGVLELPAGTVTGTQTEVGDQLQVTASAGLEDSAGPLT